MRLAVLSLAAAVALAGPVYKLKAAKNYLRNKLGMKKTVEDRLAEYGETADARWKPFFEKAKAPYPPKTVTLVGLKRELLLEVYADKKLVRTLPVLKASGGPGPKLREGDGQVPEGIYPVESLNPNSLFHLSLRVGYPNAFDRAQGKLDKRERLGGDIMIHGNEVSIGCLAMGDEAAEDLFVLAARTGLPKLKVILAPHDLRKSPPPPGQPAWTARLYADIKKALQNP